MEPIARDWFMFGKPPEHPSPILLPPILYARAVAAGADMRGYRVQHEMPKEPKP